MLITHEMQVIRDICDQVIVINQGQIVETGPVWKVFASPMHTMTQELLGYNQSSIDLGEDTLTDKHNATHTAAPPFLPELPKWVCAKEVDPGLIEAAQAIGCNRTQIIRHVLLPEALPGIIAGFTVTLVTMINSSAIAGAIGAGGLGDIAYRYGYQRFDVQMMVSVIVVLVALVMLVQATGDSLAQWVDKRQL